MNKALEKICPYNAMPFDFPKALIKLWIPTFDFYVIDVPKAQNSSIKKVFVKPIDQG